MQDFRKPIYFHLILELKDPLPDQALVYWPALTVHNLSHHMSWSHHLSYLHLGFGNIKTNIYFPRLNFLGEVGKLQVSLPFFDPFFFQFGPEGLFHHFI